MLAYRRLQICLAPGIFFIATCVFSLVLFRATEFEMTSPGSKKLPVVEAPVGPLRVLPDAPGGLTVPHQDKTIYDTFSNESRSLRVEKLLPGSETPVLPSVIQNKNIENAVSSVDKTLSVLSEESAPKSVGEDSVVSDGAMLEKGVSTPERNQENTSNGEGPIVELDSSYSVQLASFRSLDAAEIAWEKIYSRAPRLLGGLTPTIVQANLIDGGGTFYRLQAGPITDKDIAASLCKALASHNLDCLIVRQ